MIDGKDYVCTFDQSKKLMELGVKKYCIFAWGELNGKYDYLFTKQILQVEDVFGFELYKTKIPAYTLQDLYEIMRNLDYELGYEILKELYDNYSYSKEMHNPIFIADHIINYVECQKELAEGDVENEKGN